MAFWTPHLPSSLHDSVRINAWTLNSPGHLPLQEERQRLAKRLDAAQLCIEALQGELSALQSVHEKASVVLRVKTAAEESLTAQVAQVSTAKPYGTTVSSA